MGITKQVTEKHFRESVLKLPNTYIDKIQVNTFAYTPTAADFFIQNKDYDILVECKQVSLANRQDSRFYIDRLTQETKMVEWDKRFDRNKAFIFLCFWHMNKLKSHAYMIPISKWIEYRKTSRLKTLYINICDDVFKDYKVKLDSNKFWKIDFS